MKSILIMTLGYVTVAIYCIRQVLIEKGEKEHKSLKESENKNESY